MRMLLWTVAFYLLSKELSKEPYVESHALFFGGNMICTFLVCAFQDFKELFRK